jgi:hypothetical protein
MRQALHIFRKDFRYVRKELWLLFSFAALHAWVATYPIFPVWAEALLWAAASLVVVRLIHAEALPGDRQFWLTRPYSRMSLMLAKLLGVAVFAGMPILLGRLYVMVQGEFPLAAIAAPLAWSQFVVFAGALLPIAALAAVTRSMAPFMFTAVAAVGVVLIAQFSASPISSAGVRNALTGSQWIWDSVLAAMLIVMGAVTVYLQYSLRRTNLSRVFMGLIVAAGLAVYMFLPWPTAAKLQAAIPPHKFDASSLQVALRSDEKSRPVRLRKPGMAGLELPLNVGGIPEDVELVPDAIELTIRTQDGTTWSSGSYMYPVISKKAPGPGPAALNVTFDIPEELVTRGGQRATVTGELYVSVFGNAQSTNVSLQESRSIVSPTMQCQVVKFQQAPMLFCGFAFRWPDKLVYAKFPTTGMTPFTRSLSYSPFPAQLSFVPFEARALSIPSQAREATIVMAERLASIRHRFQLDNFPLAEQSRRVVYR